MDSAEAIRVKEFSTQLVLYSKDIFMYCAVYMCNHLEYL
jgi:hypothetical protein